MLDLIAAFLGAIGVFFRSRVDTSLELLALRQQVAVLKRKRPRPALNDLDRLFWIALRRYWPRWPDVLAIVKPETVRLAPGGLPTVLALAIPAAGRSANDQRGASDPDSLYGLDRELRMGSAEDPRRAAEAWLRDL